jgi:hypothetical protein
MKIEQAKQLQIGAIVHCPADRGDPGYTGKVTFVGVEVYETHGKEYIWISVKGPHHTSTWPSNRLT